MKLKSEKLLESINVFHKRKQRYPTRREMASQFKVSTETIQRHIEKLEEENKIILQKGKIIDLNFETETLYVWEVHSDYKEYGISHNDLILFSVYWRPTDADLVLMHDKRFYIQKFKEVSPEDKMNKMTGVILGIIKKAPKRYRRKMAWGVSIPNAKKIIKNKNIKKASHVSHLLFTRPAI